MTLVHGYVFLRLYSLPLRKRWVGRAVFIAAGVALWLVFFLGLVFGRHGQGVTAAFLEIAGMHWMGSVFLLAVCLFISDVACGFGFLFRKAASRIRTVGVACGLVLIVMAHVQGLRPPVVEDYDVPIQGLSAELDGTTIVVLADLHAGDMTVGPGWLNARVDQVQALRPDCIVLVGDLFERGCDPANMIPVMRRLSAPLGVWAVRGNHDFMWRNRRDVTGEILAGAGIRLLENEWGRMTDGLLIAGVDDLTTTRRRTGGGEATVERALANRPADPTIFLSHTPWMTNRAAEADVSLMLSAHTHNGQIWPFNYLVRTVYPYIQGRYNIESMTLIVTRGTGTWGPRMRLWSPGEISRVTLRKGQ